MYNQIYDIASENEQENYRQKMKKKNVNVNNNDNNIEHKCPTNIHNSFFYSQLFKIISNAQFLYSFPIELNCEAYKSIFFILNER